MRLLYSAAVLEREPHAAVVAARHGAVAVSRLVQIVEQVFNARDWRLTVAPTGHKVALSVTDVNGSHNIYLFSGLPPAQPSSEANGESQEQAAKNP